MTEPISRSDVTAKAMEVVKWLEKSKAKNAKDALQVIFYLDRVNTSLESRLAEIAHMAVQPVLLAAPEMTVETSGSDDAEKP